MSTFGVSGKPSYRSANALGFLLSAGSLAATAIYLAPIADLENCTLCSVIRLMLVVMAGLYLLGFILNIRLLQRLFGLIHLALLSTGIVTLVRHLITAETPAASCSGTTTSLFTNAPTPENLLTLLNDAALCPGLAWTIGGVGVAHLALLLYIVLLGIVWKILTKKQPRQLFF